MNKSDLIRTEAGKWLVLITVDVPDGTKVPITDFLGVDLGIANLATVPNQKAFTSWASGAQANPWVLGPVTGTSTPPRTYQLFPT
jgi:transposase